MRSTTADLVRAERAVVEREQEHVTVEGGLFGHRALGEEDELVRGTVRGVFRGSTTTTSLLLGGAGGGSVGASPLGLSRRFAPFVSFVLGAAPNSVLGAAPKRTKL